MNRFTPTHYVQTNAARSNFTSPAEQLGAAINAGDVAAVKSLAKANPSLGPSFKLNLIIYDLQILAANTPMIEALLEAGVRSGVDYLLGEVAAQGNIAGVYAIGRFQPFAITNFKSQGLTLDKIERINANPEMRRILTDLAARLYSPHSDHLNLASPPAMAERGGKAEQELAPDLSAFDIRAASSILSASEPSLRPRVQSVDTDTNSSRAKPRIDITGHELQALQTDELGQFKLPSMPCGILPFFVRGNEKVWGCVETDRVGLIVTTPPTGTQDLIAISINNSNQRLSLEIGKPIPKTGSALDAYENQSLNEKIFQEVVTTLLKSEYEVFVEHPLATAEHETFEEHGVDLRKDIGTENNRLAKPIWDFGPVEVKAKRGIIKQQIYVAQLTHVEDVKLNHTRKTEQKIAAFKSNEFYEKGVWGTLAEFKAKVEQAKLDLAGPKRPTDEAKLAIMQAEIVAFENRLKLIEDIESRVDHSVKGN